MPGKCSIRYMPSVVLEVYWLFSWGATARLEASITRTQHRYPLCQVKPLLYLSLIRRPRDVCCLSLGPFA